MEHILIIQRSGKKVNRGFATNLYAVYYNGMHISKDYRTAGDAFWNAVELLEMVKDASVGIVFR